MRILGIDPGSLATGWGVVDVEGSRLRRVAGGVIRPRCDEFALRLAEIHARIASAIGEYQPDAAALEAVFVSRNPRSALLLGHARGAALTACGSAALAAHEYAPAQVKIAVTGYGRADKAQVQAMVARLLGLSGPPATDEADALAAAVCHAASGRSRGRLERAVAASQRAEVTR